MKIKFDVCLQSRNLIYQEIFLPIVYNVKTAWRSDIFSKKVPISIDLRRRAQYLSGYFSNVQYVVYFFLLTNDRLFYSLFPILSRNSDPKLIEYREKYWMHSRGFDNTDNNDRKQRRKGDKYRMAMAGPSHSARTPSW